MKPSNTATSLLAAGVLSLTGTTIALGATTQSMAFSQTSWSGESSATLSGVNLSDTSSYESWTISFTYNYTANTSTNAWGTAILATGTEAYGNNYSGGFQIWWNNGSTNNNGALYLKYGNDSAKGTQVSISDFASQSYTLNFVVSYVYSTSTLTATVAIGENEAQTICAVSGLSSTVAFTSLTTEGASVTAPTNNSISNLSGYVTLVAVPEPSAFGLLAGLGALALAVSRRRRRANRLSRN